MAVYRALAGDQVTAAGRRVGAALAARCRSNAAPPLLLHPNAATAGSVGRVLSAAGVQSEAQGPLRLNGRACSPSTEVQAWDCLEVPGVEGPRAWGAGRFTVPPILAWNRNFIAMAKPAGMLSQPVRDAAGHATWPVEFGEGFAGCPPGAGLSVEEVANACSTLVQGKRGHALHLLHRIDRLTTGVVVLVRKRTLVSPLQEAWNDPSTVHKTYLAVVEGHPTFETRLLRGGIAPRHGTKHAFTVSPRGKPSRTEVRVLGHLPRCGASLVQCILHTGRTHQARVHLSEAGHPVVGDTLYGSSMLPEDVLAPSPGSSEPPTSRPPHAAMPRRTSPLPWGLDPDTVLARRAEMLARDAGGGDDAPEGGGTAPLGQLAPAELLDLVRGDLRVEGAGATPPPPMLLHAHGVQLLSKVRGVKLNAVAPPPPIYAAAAAQAKPAHGESVPPPPLQFRFTE